MTKSAAVIITPDTPPTDRQREIHAAMLAYQAEHLMPPTLRELCELFGISSTNGITDHLRALEKRGLVKHRPMISRGWIAVQPQPQEGTQP